MYFGYCLFTFSRHVIVQSDHKPSESIPQKFLVRRLQKCDLTVHYERGKKNIIVVDMLSRSYLPLESCEDEYVMCVNMVHYLPILDERLEEITLKTRSGPSLRSLSETILNGWPEEKKNAREITHSYLSMRDESTIQERKSSHRGFSFERNCVLRRWESKTLK